MQSEEQIMEYNVGAPPVCTAWDPSDQSNLAVISKGSNATYILRKDEPGQGKFRKCFVRRYEIPKKSSGERGHKQT